MHVGIVGPCSSGLLADLLPESGGIDLGRGGYLIATLVRALIGRGHHVSVVTLSPELSDRTILEGPKLTYYVYPKRTRKVMRDLYRHEREGLKDGIFRAKPDILHAHWTYERALACLETGFPTLITCHDNGFKVLRFKRDLFRVGRLYLQIRVIRSARFLTAVSPYLADSLRWLAKTEIEVVPNPVELNANSENTREQASGPVRIATVLNGWGHLKNPKPAIKAFNLLRGEIPDAEMYMYGTGFEEDGPAWHWAARKGLSRNIHFCGRVPHRDLQTRLSEMSILLHPSLEESFGMAVVEAIALGLPVVAGVRSGAVPWVLDGGRAGFLTDVRKPERIAETLLTCLRQKEDREQRQINAHDRVLRLFSPSSVAEQYQTLYHKVLTSW